MITLPVSIIIIKTIQICNPTGHLLPQKALRSADLLASVSLCKKYLFVDLIYNSIDIFFYERFTTTFMHLADTLIQSNVRVN